MKNKKWAHGVGELAQKNIDRQRARSAQLLRMGLISGTVEFNEHIGKGLRQEQILKTLAQAQRKEDFELPRLQDLCFGLGRAFTAAEPGVSAEYGEPSISWLFAYNKRSYKGPQRVQTEREYESTLAFIAGMCAASGALVCERLAGDWLTRLIIDGDLQRLERALSCGLSVWGRLSDWPSYHPVEIAYQQDRLEIAQLLLMRGAHPNGQDWKKRLTAQDKIKQQQQQQQSPTAGAFKGLWIFDAHLQAAAQDLFYAWQSPRKLGDHEIRTERRLFSASSFGGGEIRRRPSDQAHWNEKAASDFARPLWDLHKAFETPEEAWTVVHERSVGRLKVWAEKGMLSTAASPAHQEKSRLRI